MNDIKYGILITLDLENSIYNDVNILQVHEDINTFFIKNKFNKITNNLFITNENVVHATLTAQKLTYEVVNLLIKDFQLLRITDINDLKIILDN